MNVRRRIKGVSQYIRLFLLFIKYALLVEMEYKLNFISGILVECGYFLVKLAYVFIAFQVNIHRQGLKPEEVSMYVGTFTIITAFFMFFWPSFLKLSTNIRDGTLDVLLTKPIDLQFLMTLRYLSFSMIFPNLIGGMSLLIYGWLKSGQVISLIGIIQYTLLILLGAILIYSLFLIPKAFLSFWFISSSSADLLISSIWDANNMPMSIYGKGIRFVGIYIIPIFLIANYPPMVILGRLTIWKVLWEVIATALAFAIARGIFNRGIRRYNSASS